MANIISNVQEKIKTSSHAAVLLTFKAISGLFVGLTLALIAQEIIRYGWFSFLFVMVVVAASLMRIMKSWSWTHTVIFDLICVLIGLLLRMYILIAPSV